MLRRYSIGFDLNQSGSILASGSINGSIYIYNTNTSKLITRIDAFNKQHIKQPCTDVKFQQFNASKSQSASSLSTSASASSSLLNLRSNDSASGLRGENLAVSSLNGQIKVYEL